jgi:glucose 1-dehydrogenase
MKKLSGLVAVVTGGARGIGGASAVAFAAEGASVVINDRLPRESASSVDQIEQAGGKVAYVQGDASLEETSHRIVETALSQFGSVDIALCNCAKGFRQPFVEMDSATARQVFDVTFWAGFYLSQAAARQMIAQGRGGSIVFISSVHSVQPYANAVTYNAAKAAVNHHARTIALELAPHKIRVNWIEPGWIDTPGERIAFGEQAVAEGGARLLWGRLGQPEEIAKGVIFLASDDSSYMTGAGLRLDGGFVLPRS